MLVTPDQAFPAYPTWLEDAVFYEIYPQSFNDSNGDGIGDFIGFLDGVARNGREILFEVPRTARAGRSQRRHDFEQA